MIIIRIISYYLYQSFRHPLSMVVQPGNPEAVKMSAIPWWGSGIILVIGIVSWCLSAHWNIVGLDEAARAMVYIPLGNIFGMGMAVAVRAGKSS